MSYGSQKIRGGLVIAQVALAFVLLIASGLMIRSFQFLRNVDAGFGPSVNIQTVAISIPQASTRDFKLVVRKFNDIQDRLAEIAAVDSVGFASRVPLGDTEPSGVFFIENKTPTGVAPPQQEFRFVSPDFFKTIGARLVAGRDFNWADHHESRPVAMVSEAMALREWGSAAAAIGNRIRITPAEGAPLAQFMSRTVTFVIGSTRVGTPGFLEDLQKAIWSVDGTLPLANVQTMAAYSERTMERTRLTLNLSG